MYSKEINGTYLNGEDLKAMFDNIGNQVATINTLIRSSQVKVQNPDEPADERTGEDYGEKATVEDN